MRQKVYGEDYIGLVYSLLLENDSPLTSWAKVSFLSAFNLDFGPVFDCLNIIVL